MRAYRKYLTIKNPKEVTLSDLPFAAGDCVEVVMIATGSSPAAQLETLHTLFKTTQALPQARTLTEADLVAEVAAVRTR
jgi:antitoxin ParD1/3/4